MTEYGKTVCGIVAEYNPFHYGHKRQIELTRKAVSPDVMVAVMSGNFVQRGEPAVVDKWTRAAAAVEQGIDIVFELPTIYSLQAASAFAHGSISVLKKAGITHLSFGSECGDLDNLQDIASTSIDPDHLRASLSSGIGYPKAYGLLTREMAPNDILAVAYLKEIADTDIRPVLIQRTGDYLDPAIGEYSSALAIREALYNSRDIGDSTPMKDILTHADLNRLELYYPYLRMYLLTAKRDQLQSVFLFNEGIERHLVRQAEDNPTYQGFLDSCVNARYTRSRIRRCLCHLLLGITYEEVKRLPAWDTLRVLAFNDTGRKYLRELKDSGVRVASTYAENPRPWREIELRAANVYGLVLPEEKRVYINKREIQGPVYRKPQSESLTL